MSIEKVSLDKPPRHKLSVLKLNQCYRLHYRQLALSVQAWMSETVWTWQYRALCRFIDALSLQGKGITWDSKEATCLLIQSTMTSKDHIVLIIKISRVRSCPVTDLQFSPRLMWQMGAAPGKNHIETQVGRASQRAQELCMSSFYATHHWVRLAF